MTTVFHRQLLQQTVTFLLLIFGWTILGFVQTDNDFDDNNPFEHRQFHFTTLDSNKIKTIIPKINIQKTNAICYRDSYLADTIRLAYSIKDKNKWVSFATPFHNNVIPGTQVINIDNKGQPEIIIDGTIFYDGFPHGEHHNQAIIIFNIDSIPTQIFKIFYRCYEFMTYPDGQGNYDFVYERKVKIAKGKMTIEKLIPKSLDKDKDEQEIQFINDCHLTDIESGTYKLINGQFRRQIE